MAFAGNPDINFTAKTGVVTSGSDLTSWTDQISSEVLNDTSSPPQVSASETLNSVNVVDFSTGLYIATTSSTYDRSSGASGRSTSIYMVMKSPLNAFGYITTPESEINRNSIRGRTTGVDLRNGGNTSAIATIPADEWGVLRAVHSSVENSQIWWNNDLLVDESSLGSSSSSGIVFGARPGGFDSDFDMTVAQIVEYADQTALSQADHEQNLAEFESEWGLTLLDPEWSPYLINGQPQAGIVVEYTAYDDRDKTNPNLLERVVTDAQGNAPLTESVPEGKHLAVRATYVDSGTGDTYADIERWIEDYPE